MRKKAFGPNEPDRIEARQGYIRYAVGAACLHVPEHTQAMHRGHLDSKDGTRHIISQSEQLMLAGLKMVIKFSNPPSIRHDFREMESEFDAALPHMQATVIEAYEEEAERLYKISPALDAVRPAAMTNGVIYRRICHGNLDRVKTLDLLDTLTLSPLMDLDELLGKPVATPLRAVG